MGGVSSARACGRTGVRSVAGRGSDTRPTHPARVGCATVRVLMLSWEYPPGAAGGMAAHVDGLSRAMASAGHDVVLFTRTNPACAVDEVINGVRVVRADVDMPWLRADAEVAAHSLRQPRVRRAIGVAR